MLSVTRWNPFEELTAVHRELGRVFRGYGGGAVVGEVGAWVPPTEVTSDEKGWKVRMALPGIDPQDVHVDLNHNLLTVRGERTLKEEKAEQHMWEIGYGKFERSFTLPENVDSAKVIGNLENGMLELTLPMTEASQSRRIEIAGVKTAPRKVA